MHKFYFQKYTPAFFLFVISTLATFISPGQSFSQSLDLSGRGEELILAQAGDTTAPAPPGDLRVSSADILNIRVSGSNNDAEEGSDGSVYLSSSDLELVRDSDNQTVGIRFFGVWIPKGAVIENAYVQFTVDETSSESTSLLIRGEDADNATVFDTSTNNISSRAVTSASVSWNPPAWNTVGASGLHQRTPDLSSLLQEIVDRNGWQRGNSLVIIITGNGKRTAESVDGGSSAAPLLHIEYSDGHDPNNPVCGDLVCDPTEDRNSCPQDCGDIVRVWAVGDGERVKKDDIRHPWATSPDNSVWDGSTISLFGAKNEIIAFQLIIQAGNPGADNVDVKLISLSNGNYRIENSPTSAGDPFNYVGKRIEMFTQHYLNITQRSHTWWPAAQPVPDEAYLGWLPEILIPFQAPDGLGGAPFDIDPNMNQGVWVDLYIPKDAPPGDYHGNLEVSVSNVTSHVIPVSLRVHDFALPDESHLKTMFVMIDSALVERHGVSRGSSAYFEVERRYYQMAHRHRMDLARRIPNLTYMENHQKGYLTGEYYTPAFNYQGPGENIPQGTFSIGPYNYRPEEFFADTEAGWRAGSDAWVTWFKNNAPTVEFHKYMLDEPDGPAEYENICQRANWVHNNPGPGKEMMIYAASTMPTELRGCIDFWTCNNACDLNVVRSEQSLGQKVGYYNGWRPFAPNYVMDAPAVEWRLRPWVVWRYNLDQYFYWWITGERDVDSKERINVFVDPQTRTTAYGVQNGNGILIYPGEDRLFPEQNRGLPGPLASIRMKNFRRGMQDYEYLWLAKQAGFESAVNDIVQQCIPTAFSDANSKAQPTWTEHGHVVEQYRRQLAGLIE